MSLAVTVIFERPEPAYPDVWGVIIHISIGDLIYEESGRVTSQRVLDVNGPIVENSYSAAGALTANGTLTYTYNVQVSLKLQNRRFFQNHFIFHRKNCSTIFFYMDHNL